MTRGAKGEQADALKRLRVLHAGSFLLSSGATQFIPTHAAMPRFQRQGPMKNPTSTMAQQIAKSASVLEQQRTGLAPSSVTVVLSEETLVITLHGALSPAEKALALTAEGAARVQEFHRQLFTTSAEPLRQEIERITGIAVREATAEVETAIGTVVQVFTTGAMVQVFLLVGKVPTETWSGNGQGLPFHEPGVAKPGVLI